MSEGLIITEQSGGVVKLTLNRPEALNALRVDMLTEFAHALDRVRDQKTARCLLLTGAGRAFCAGADLMKGTGASDEKGASFDAGRVLEAHFNPIAEKLANLPVPIVCAVRGAVVGAGCSFALAGDIVIADETAFFMLAFSKAGLIPDAGMTWLLPRLIGHARAGAMMLLAERIPAKTALDWGLIYRVTAADQLMPTAMEMAEKLANGPTVAYNYIRQGLRQSMSSNFAEALQFERVHQRLAGLTTDYTEGVSAFREKREPKFSGR